MPPSGQAAYDIPRPGTERHDAVLRCHAERDHVTARMAEAEQVRTGAQAALAVDRDLACDPAAREQVSRVYPATARCAASPAAGGYSRAVRLATRNTKPVRRRRPWRLTWLVPGISWTLAGGLAAWAAVRVTGADRVYRIAPPVTPMLSFTPQVARVAPLAALGLGVAGQRGPAATAAVAAAALVAVTGPRAAARRQPDASGPELRVLTVNVLCGRADPETVTALVRRTDADVLFLQELTDDAVARLSQAGLDDLMPHKVTELRGSSLGSGIYSRFPLEEGQPLAPAYAAQPTAMLRLPGGETVEVGCVHPRAPLPPSAYGVARWRGELAVLPAPGKLPRVLAGDFNATLDHAPFRGVLRLGYADAAQQAGNGLVPTWGRLGLPAVLTIDHVLVDRRCAVLASSVHAVPGTDHRAVYAKIRLPGQ